MSKLTLKGPYEIKVSVHITDGDRDGTITIELGIGQHPTQEEINTCIAQAEEKAKEVGFRLMNKHEFFNTMLRDRFGATEEYAIPGGDAWDV